MTTDPRDPPPEHGLPPDEFLPEEPLSVQPTPEQPTPQPEGPPLPEAADQAPAIEPITPSEVLLPGFDPSGAEERPRIAEFGRYARPAGVRISPDADDDRPFWNPYVFAGIAVTGAILLAIVVVFFFGGGGASTSSSDDGSSADIGTPIPGRGLKVKVISPATMRTGPGREYDAISELARGHDVEVYGRNADDTWFAVYYPPGSALSGWVPGSAIKLPSDISGLPLVSTTPIPRPTVIIPTTPPEPTDIPTITPTPTVTGTVVVAPDISVAIQGGCVIGRSVTILVTNAPRGAAFEGRTVRIVVTEAGAVVKQLDASLSLAPGQQQSVDTGYAPRGVGAVVVTANFEGAPQDSNPGNNTAQCIPGVPSPTPPATTILPTIPPRSPTP